MDPKETEKKLGEELKKDPAITGEKSDDDTVTKEPQAGESGKDPKETAE